MSSSCFEKNIIYTANNQVTIIMEQFNISLIAMAIVSAVIYFGGLTGIFIGLVVMFVEHVIQRIN